MIGSKGLFQSLRLGGLEHIEWISREIIWRISQPNQALISPGLERTTFFECAWFCYTV